MKNSELIFKIRVMSYNVHSCRGLDGRVLPQRIAEVIEQYNPDVIALQELDVNRRGTKMMDQPRLIAQHLRMHCHFQPAIAVEGEHYGIAVLSRYPFSLKKSGDLACDSSAMLPKGKRLPIVKYFFESRHAILTSMTIGGTEVYFANTHLSLRSKERLTQAKSLVGPQWLNMDAHRVPTIFCGDFNEGPRSRACHLLNSSFGEVKSFMDPKSSRKTFLSWLPVVEVDHIFFNGNFHVESVHIPATPLTKIASDHLPIIADLSLYKGQS